MSSNSSIVVKRFFLFHTLRIINTSRLAKNAAIMPSCGFSSQLYCKYLDLYSSAYCDKFWLPLHLVAPKDVTSSRCRCGFRYASKSHSFNSFHGKVSARELCQLTKETTAPPLRNDPKLLTLSSSSRCQCSPMRHNMFRIPWGKL